MATEPFLPDETKPTDSDLISQFPAVERTFRDVVESWINIDHDTSGFHKTVTLPEQGSDPVSTANAGKLYTKDVSGLTQLFYRDAGGIVSKIDNLPSGTKLLFHQAVAPVGWTRDVATTLNDTALRVVTSAGFVGGRIGGTGFDLVFGASKLTGAHALSLAELPNHAHSGTMAAAAGTGSPAGANPHAAVGGSMGSVGSNAAHSHTLSLNLAYINMIICSKD